MFKTQVWCPAEKEEGEQAKGKTKEGGEKKRDVLGRDMYLVTHLSSPHPGSNVH